MLPARGGERVVETACIEALRAAAGTIAGAGALLITAGAGMGVDSGLPDFRGREGFWRAYPALRAEGLELYDIACPEAFASRPRLAWGFYGHRLNLYRDAPPHPGFAILRRWAGRLPGGAFVFTSNVDGQFQRAGFAEDGVYECHGSIHHLQCAAPCCGDIWPADGLRPRVDAARCRLCSALPGCPHCGGLARPNILLFGDGQWLPARSDRQRARLRGWLAQVERPVVLELGAGTAIPTVRRFGESLGVPLLRINPEDAQVGGAGQLSIALRAIDRLL